MRHKVIETLIRFYCRVIPIQKGKRRIIKVYSKYAGLRGEAVVRTSFDVSMQLDLSQFVQREIFFRGAYEEHVLNVIQELAEKNRFDLFLDVGANVGQHSLFAVKRTPIPKSIAFEASPHVFLRLQKNIAINNMEKLIQPYNLAILDAPGFVSIEVPNPTNDGTGYVLDGKEGEVDIEAVSLDDFFSQHEDYKDILMKIDVEGAELRVLKGARKLFSAGKIKAIIVEVIKDNLARFGDDNVDLFRLLVSEYGFKAYILSESGKLISLIDPGKLPDEAEMIFLQEAVLL